MTAFYRFEVQILWLTSLETTSTHTQYIQTEQNRTEQNNPAYITAAS